LLVNSIANRVVQGSISCITCTTHVLDNDVAIDLRVNVSMFEWHGDDTRRWLRLQSRRFVELLAACLSGPLVILQVPTKQLGESFGHRSQRVTFHPAADGSGRWDAHRHLSTFLETARAKFLSFWHCPNGRVGCWHALCTSLTRLNPAISR
jgi:hypothetical protein